MTIPLYIQVSRSLTRTFINFLINIIPQPEQRWAQHLVPHFIYPGMHSLTSIIINEIMLNLLVHCLRFASIACLFRNSIRQKTNLKCSVLLQCSGTHDMFGICLDGCRSGYKGLHCLEQSIEQMFAKYFNSYDRKLTA